MEFCLETSNFIYVIKILDAEFNLSAQSYVDFSLFVDCNIERICTTLGKVQWEFNLI
jgi:hypothetical protein